MLDYSCGLAAFDMVGNLGLSCDKNRYAWCWSFSTFAYIYSFFPQHSLLQHNCRHRHCCGSCPTTTMGLQVTGPKETCRRSYPLSPLYLTVVFQPSSRSTTISAQITSGDQQTNDTMNALSGKPHPSSHRPPPTGCRCPSIPQWHSRFAFSLSFYHHSQIRLQDKDVRGGQTTRLVHVEVQRRD